MNVNHLIILWLTGGLRPRAHAPRPTVFKFVFRFLFHCTFKDNHFPGLGYSFGCGCFCVATGDKAFNFRQGIFRWSTHVLWGRPGKILCQGTRLFVVLVNWSWSPQSKFMFDPMVTIQYILRISRNADRLLPPPTIAGVQLKLHKLVQVPTNLSPIPPFSKNCSPAARPVQK